MIIIIDGYNILKQALHTREISDSAKITFIAQLSSYGKRKGHTIIVVFDGGGMQWVERQKIKEVTVVHSGVKESADDWIKDYIHRHRGQDLLLISTDRALCAVAHQNNIASLDSIDFYYLLQEGLHKKSPKTKIHNPLVKMSQDSLSPVDVLMEEASEIVHAKGEDILKRHASGKTQALSKKERNLLKKLNKL